LLDNNVVSEWLKPSPGPGAIAWLETTKTGTFLSLVALAEIRYGIEPLARGRRRNQLDGWLRSDPPDRFSGRIIAIDDEIAFARPLISRAANHGYPTDDMDAFIAADRAGD